MTVRRPSRHRSRRALRAHAWLPLTPHAACVRAVPEVTLAPAMIEAITALKKKDEL